MGVKLFTIKMETNMSNDSKSVVNSNDGDLVPAHMIVNSHVDNVTEPNKVPTGNFNDMVDVSLTTIMSPYNLDENLKGAQKPLSELAIKDFLARPFQILSGNFSNTDTSTTFSEIGVMSHLNFQTYFYEKLKGYMGIRAKTIFRLVVNAQRFQQGRYIMFWMPTGGATDTTQLAIWKNMHRYDLTQITQLPHVEIDIPRESEAILEIPYASASLYFAINSGNINWGSPGSVYIVPYEPLNAVTGSQSCSFDLFVSYEDVELGAPMYPQSDMRFKKNPAESEQKSQNIGPLSSALTNVSDAANALARIPTLSSIASPAAWALDIARGAANAFGWSNPLSLAPVERMSQRLYPFANNADVADVTQPLSLMARNTVDVLPGLAGTDIDEMAIDFLKSRFAWFQTISWSTSVTAGTQLLSLPLHPKQYVNNYTPFGGSFTLTPVAFLANIFQQYRGGLMFKVKIVSTEYHTGRLLVAFQPNEPQVSGPPSVSNANSVYTMREIIDIRNGTEFCICVPYVSLTEYRDCNGAFNSYGNLIFSVLNPLVAPSTVANSVKLLLEVAGAPDLEFAVPTGSAMQPTTTQGLQSNMLFMDYQSNLAFAPNAKCMFDHVIGGGDIPTQNDTPARMCVGERITSLNQLLKKSDWNRIRVTPPNNPTWGIDPYVWAPGFADSPTTRIDPYFYADYFTIFSSMYAFSRGGVRVRTAPTDPTQTPGNFLQCMINSPSTGTTYDAGTVLSPSIATRMALRVFTLRSHTGGNEVQVPMYSKYHTRASAAEMACWGGNAGSPLVTYGNLGVANVQLYFTNPSTAISTDQWYRQGADDAQFALFVSIPTMYFPG